ncbi:MAG: hypothetical protein AAGA80_27660, partial [Cyanobacteria bacterium P01_F01_bin.143]
NLKWDEDTRSYTELFLKHLALHISALAASEGVNKIQWSVSYPPSFSDIDKIEYSRFWQDVLQELSQSTGIKHKNPEINSRNLCLQDIAFAQYFADEEKKDLVYTTCINMERDISDIAIWENNQIIHKCSVDLTGQDFFLQFLKLNPTFAEKKFGLDPEEWEGLGTDTFKAKLDVWLRYRSKQWLDKNRSLQRRDPEFQGLNRLIAIGFAGLHYYVGMMLRVLDMENKYQHGKITPVYLGGQDSRFLNWLDERGEFDRNSEMNELFSRMLSAGSNFRDSSEITIPSQNPQDEIACGLVLNRTKLQGLGRKVKDPIISGESCYLNGKEFTAYQRLALEDCEENITEFTIPYLVEVPKFLYAFHKAIKDLELESITGLQGYDPSPATFDNHRLWQETQRELNKTLLNLKGDSKDIRPESTFILGLKALLTVLGKQWASS